MRMYRKLPQFVYIGGRRYKINTDFRLFIEFEEEIMKQVEYGKVIMKTLKRFYPAFFEILKNRCLEEAVDKFLWFYRCGKEYNINENKKVNGERINYRIFSYKYDSDLIWSAYYDKGIDLTTDRLHWWKFKAIFVSLPSDCEFRKVMSYRCYDGDDKNLLELKEEYKLPLTKYEIDNRIRQDKIFEELKKLEKRC